MSDPFIGEICPLPYNYSPLGWAYCSGQLIAINQNTALYSILGYTFGGVTNQSFGVPKLQAAVVPMGAGTGTGLTPRVWGKTTGAATIQLDSTQIASHTHSTKFAMGGTTTSSPSGNYLGQLREETAPNTFTARAIYEKTAPEDVTFPAAALLAAGGNAAHENRQPFLALNFCIALTGLYPVRS
ncbi:MAG TPA: tail fiber protein [Gallionella sp.]|nr:tail fiber protein [Gallionella sp.]